jgi:hypothetical protein
MKYNNKTRAFLKKHQSLTIGELAQIVKEMR